MLADITGGGGLANFAGIVYASGGDTNNVKPGLDTIGTIKGAKFWKAGADVIAGFKAGDIYAAVAHTGWCLRAIKYAGANVASVHPKINATKTGVLKVGWIGVVKGTKNPRRRWHFINGYLDEEFQLGFAKNTGVWPANTKVRPRLRTEDRAVRVAQQHRPGRHRPDAADRLQGRQHQQLVRPVESRGERVRSRRVPGGVEVRTPCRASS